MHVFEWNCFNCDWIFTVSLLLMVQAHWMITQWRLKLYSLSVRNFERHIFLIYLFMNTMELHVIQCWCIFILGALWMVMEPNHSYIELHNLKWCSITWIMELRKWIMGPHNLRVLSPSALHMIQQNINKISFRKISPEDFYFLPLFSICT